MARRIVSTGRGGTGKSTFVALATRFLKPPTLLVDLDPDLSLADMLGADFAREGKRTVSEVLYDVIARRKSNISPSITTNELMESLLWSDCLYESAKFDLITLGTKLTEGCYCAPDNLLRRTIPKLAKNYVTVVVDSPAGVEHLNRKVMSEVDDMFVLCDPSDKSLKHITRIEEILRQVGTKYNHLYLVGSHEFNEQAEDMLRSSGHAYLGRIDHDPEVEKYNLEGRSLLRLPDDSPALLSVQRILAKAGYR